MNLTASEKHANAYGGQRDDPELMYYPSLLFFWVTFLEIMYRLLGLEKQENHREVNTTAPPELKYWSSLLF